MSSSRPVLELDVGDARPFTLELVEKTDQLLPLTGIDAARVRVFAYAGAATSLINKAATWDIATSKLIVTLTQVEADALVPGSYLGRGTFRVSGTARWTKTKRFRVVVNPGDVSNLP